MDQCLQTGSHLMVVSPLPSLGIMPSCVAAAEYRAVSKSQLTWTLSAGVWVEPFLGEQTILDHKLQFLILVKDWLIS